jgi:hypothetical protein
MAKEKRANSAVSAISSLLDVIGTVAAAELKDNPTALAQVTKMTEDVKDSNLTTAMENLDDAIELQHEIAAEQAEQEAEAAEEAAEEETKPEQDAE